MATAWHDLLHYTRSTSDIMLLTVGGWLGFVVLVEILRRIALSLARRRGNDETRTRKEASSWAMLAIGLGVLPFAGLLIDHGHHQSNRTFRGHVQRLTRAEALYAMTHHRRFTPDLIRLAKIDRRLGDPADGGGGQFHLAIGNGGRCYSLLATPGGDSPVQSVTESHCARR